MSGQYIIHCMQPIQSSARTGSGGYTPLDVSSSEGSYTFFGQSSIIGPRGKVYASVEEPREGYAVARIDLDEVREHREDTQVLQCRKPTTYRAIVKKY